MCSQLAGNVTGVSVRTCGQPAGNVLGMAVRAATLPAHSLICYEEQVLDACMGSQLAGAPGLIGYEKHVLDTLARSCALNMLEHMLDDMRMIGIGKFRDT